MVLANRPETRSIGIRSKARFGQPSPPGEIHKASDDAWASVSGLSAEEARRRYVEAVAALPDAGR